MLLGVPKDLASSSTRNLKHSHVLIRGSAVEIVHSIRKVTHKGVDR